MLKNNKIENIGIEKCVAEFQIWLPDILPCEKMKIKIYEQRDHLFWGHTNVMLVRKFDNSPEGAGDWGDSIEKALINTINEFLKMVEEDYPRSQYPKGLSVSDIQYSEDSDF